MATQTIDDVRRATWARPMSFRLVGVTLIIMLASSTVPSPIYVVYAQRFGMSSAMITVIFAVYAVAVMIGLLVLGSLSDDIGRRPVLLASMTLLAISMCVFALSSGVGWLIVARVVQGAGVGLATGALSASVLELAPERAPQRGTLINAVGPTLGIAVGALLSGLLVAYAPAPTVLSFVVMAICFVAIGVAMLRLPETAPRRRTTIRIRPHRIAVPAGQGRPFAAASLGLVAGWAVGGFYLSLGPSLAAHVLRTNNHLIGGLTITVLAGTAAIAQVVGSRASAISAALLGLALLVVGLGLVLASIMTDRGAVAFVAGNAVLGAGWGLTFLGVFRLIATLAQPEHRGEVLSAGYVVAYLSMSLPAVLIGFTVRELGLVHGARLFVEAVIAVCLLAVIGLALTRRSPASQG